MRKSNWLLAASFVAAGILGGCIDLKVERFDAANNATASSGDFIYALPKTAIVISGTVTLNDCDSIVYPDQKTPIDISENIVVASNTIADKNYQYKIPYESLQTWMKQVNISMSLNSNKALQSVNGTVVDQAGPTALAALQTIIQIGGAAALPITPALRELAHKKLAKNAIAKKASEPKQYCSKDIDEALQRIATDNAIISKASSKGGGSSSVSPAVSKAQADISATVAEYKLARQFTVTWSPSREIDMPTAPNATDGIAIVSNTVPIYQAVIVPAKWLNVADENVGDVGLWLPQQADPLSVKLSSPVSLQLLIKAWTIGAVLPDSVPAGGSQDTPTNNNPHGLIVRDPALGLLRVCAGSCLGRLRASGDVAATGDIAIAQKDSLDSLSLDTSNDLAAPTAINLPQFGRTLIEPLHNGLFENSTVAVSLNSDSTIQNLGNTDSNTFAAAATAAGGAAGAYSSATTTYNSAVNSQNTAVTNAAQYVDTVNKAVADCLAQQAAIVKAGGRPVGQCQ